jgi:hypothetical protein
MIGGLFAEHRVDFMPVRSDLQDEHALSPPQFLAALAVAVAAAWSAVNTAAWPGQSVIPNHGSVRSVGRPLFQRMTPLRLTESFHR